MVVCFRGCFGSSSKITRKSPHNKKIKRNVSHEPLQTRFYSDQGTKPNPVNQTSAQEDKHEELLNVSIGEKETLKPNINIYETVSTEEDKDEKQSGSSIRNNDTLDASTKTYGRVLIEEDKREEGLSVINRKKVTFNANVKTYEPVLVLESTEGLAVDIQDNKQKEENFEKNGISCYPSNHRYNNCQESDEEIDEFESQDSYIDDDDSEYVEECDFENFDESTDEINNLEDTRERKIVGHRDRGIYVHPVLYPVDNLDQRKTLKKKTKTETNILQDHSLYDFNCKTDQIEKKYQEVVVDASLSNWLVSSKMSTEDRSFLGTLTMEKDKEFNVLKSGRRSDSRDSVEMASFDTYRSYMGPRVKDIGAAFSYKRLPREYQEVLVK